MILKNIEIVKEKMARAAERSGRKGEDITLIAVTKTVPPERINEAIAAGIKDIGENYVQEYLAKKSGVEGARWHLIGHVQTNKIKYLDGVSLIQAVDSERLLEEINKKGEKDILLEINIAEENSKFGLTKKEIPYIINKIVELKNVRVKGLMTIAPYAQSGQEVRWVFRELKKIADGLANEKYPNITMDNLSMGMSGDYETAIEEGSNMVRIGSAIFGNRVYL